MRKEGGKLTIGVLALQGGFSKHLEVLHSLGIPTLEVRTPHQLMSCQGLIIPGGESTTIRSQLSYAKMEEPLAHFIAHKPVFGTCAGLILLADGPLAIQVERNSYGRQYHSFQTTLTTTLPHKKTCPALFIRAPRVTKVDQKKVTILAKHNNDPVLLLQGHILGATFHPELTSDRSIHQYFCNLAGLRPHP